MNESKTQHRSDRITNAPLDQPREGNASSPKRSESARQKNGSRRTYQGLSLWLFLWGSLYLHGCGNEASRHDTLKPDATQVAQSSQANCKASPLVGEWRQFTPFQDVVKIGADCSFQSFTCDTVGYVNSSVDTYLGIADIVIVYTGSKNPYCPPPGSYKCAYDARLKAYKEIELLCR
jgi:hypothetical protein